MSVLWFQDSLILLIGQEGPHEGTTDAAVEQDPPQNEETPSPAILVLEELPQWGETAEGHRAARRRQAVGKGTLFAEVSIEHDQRGLEVQRQTQTWGERANGGGLLSLFHYTQ